MWRIEFYKDKIRLVVSIIFSYASVSGAIIPLLQSHEDVPWWIVILITLSAILVIGTLVLVVIQSDAPTRVYKVEDKLGVRNYMFQWIQNGGRVAVWTRDMSWVDDDDMKQMLRQKAESQELIICLQREIDNSAHLEQYGAEVATYGASYSPASIFTIVNFGRNGSRVAVGRRMGNLHIIQEYSADEHPAFHMAYDLVRLTRDRNHVREQ